MYMLITKIQRKRVRGAISKESSDDTVDDILRRISHVIETHEVPTEYDLQRCFFEPRAADP